MSSIGDERITANKDATDIVLDFENPSEIALKTADNNKRAESLEPGELGDEDIKELEANNVVLSDVLKKNTKDNYSYDSGRSRNYSDRNNFDFHGRRSDRNKNSEYSRTLFVGNIPRDIVASKLEDVFRKYGEIIDVDIKSLEFGATTYAFIQFIDAATSTKAFNGELDCRIDGNPINVGYGRGSPSEFVWVGGFKSDQFEQLEALIAQLDGVSWSLTDKELVQCLIRFKNSDEGVAACDSLKFKKIDDTKLLADYMSLLSTKKFVQRMEASNQKIEHLISEDLDAFSDTGSRTNYRKNFQLKKLDYNSNRSFRSTYTRDRDSDQKSSAYVKRRFEPSNHRQSDLKSKYSRDNRSDSNDKEDWDGRKSSQEYDRRKRNRSPIYYDDKYGKRKRSPLKRSSPSPVSNPSISTRRKSTESPDWDEEVNSNNQPAKESSSGSHPHSSSAHAEEKISKIASNCLWTGKLLLKNKSIDVSFVYLKGNRSLFDICLTKKSKSADKIGSLNILQRMKLNEGQLDLVRQRLLCNEDYSSALAVNSSESKINRDLMNTSFISYFSKKEAAGVVHFFDSERTMTHVIYVFPPCEFSRTHIQHRVSDDLQKYIDTSQYLLILAIRCL